MKETILGYPPAAIAFALLAGSVAALVLYPPGPAIVVPAVRKDTVGSSRHGLPIPLPEKSERTWIPPPPQARGAGWVFDLFTPPAIYYDSSGQRYTLAPAVQGGMSTPPPPPRIELHSVRAARFRVQLIGHVGGPADGRGAFRNLQTGEVFLAGSGRAVPSQQLEVDRVAIELTRLSADDSARRRIAVARLRDTTTGEEVDLRAGGPASSRDAVAVISVAGESQVREVRVGDRISADGKLFRVQDIGVSPAALTIIPEAPDDGTNDPYVLYPPEASP